MPRLRPILSLPILILSLAAAACAQEREVGEPATVTTTGRAEVALTPDRGEVTFTIERRAETAAEALADASEAMTRALEAARGLGMADLELSTEAARLWPVRERRRPEPGGLAGVETVGYRAVQTARAYEFAPDRAGAVIDAVVAGGANAGLEVRFYAADASAAERRALEDAARDARARAEAIARGLGQTLGPALEVEETLGRAPSPRAFRAAAAVEADAVATPVEAGDLTVTAEVRLVSRLD